MVQINFGQREVSCKVVFYGPGMSGKTTNLEIIHKKAPKDAVGEMVSIATETDRTLYFDFLPLDLGQVAGMRTKFQLYTVPGQIYYNATRKLVLQGVDGVIFVADSSPEKMAENLESLQNLRDNLAEMGLQVEDVPIVLQYNKRDLPTAMSIDDMNAKMNPMGAPVFEGVAREGKGVFATLKEISRLVIEKLNKDHAPASTRRRSASNLETAKSPSGGVPVQHGSGANKIPPMPIPQGQTPRPMPSPIQGTSTTPLGQQRLQQRPTQPQRAAGQGSGGNPIPPAPPQRQANNPGVPQQRPTYTPTPAAGNAIVPPEADLSPKDKHLAKTKPPALENRRGGANPDLGATDPNLRRYQDAQKSGGGAVKALVMILLFLIIALILLVILCLFVPAVRAQLPRNMQKMFMGETDAPVAPGLPRSQVPAQAAAPTAAASTSTPPIAQAPASAPAAAAEPAKVPTPAPVIAEPATPTAPTPETATPAGGADGK